MTGIEQAIKQAGSVMALADLIQTTPQFVTNSKRKGYLPLERAKIVQDAYGIPLRELVRKDIADAMNRA